MSEEKEKKDNENEKNGNDKYLSVKIDIGTLWKKANTALLRGKDQATFYFSEADNPGGKRPLFKSRNGAVWLNESQDQEDKAPIENIDVEDI